jgi:hypothetical protein
VPFVKKMVKQNAGSSIELGMLNMLNKMQGAAALHSDTLLY